MHYWTKEAFLENNIAVCKAKGLEVTERMRIIFEWGGELVELAYNCGLKDGKEAAQPTSRINT